MSLYFCLTILSFLNAQRTIIPHNHEYKKYITNETIIRSIRKSEEYLYTTNSQGKVLLYFSSTLETHWGKSDQLSQFKYLWPIALRKNNMLRNADILIYAGISLHDNNTVISNKKKQYNISTTPAYLYYELHQAALSFPNKNVTIKYMNNVGYQQGAVKVMIDGLNEGWFNGYDWVIRLNPDTMIYDDTRLASYLNNNTCTVVLANGNNRGILLLSDFFAFRPDRVDYSRWDRAYMVWNAERWTTNAFSYLISEQQHIWIQATPAWCMWRVSQADIVHAHYKWADQVYRFFDPSHVISIDDNVCP